MRRRRGPASSVFIGSRSSTVASSFTRWRRFECGKSVPQTTRSGAAAISYWAKGSASWKGTSVADTLSLPETFTQPLP